MRGRQRPPPSPIPHLLPPLPAPPHPDFISPQGDFIFPHPVFPAPPNSPSQKISRVESVSSLRRHINTLRRDKISLRSQPVSLRMVEISQRRDKIRVRNDVTSLRCPFGTKSRVPRALSPFPRDLRSPLPSAAKDPRTPNGALGERRPADAKKEIQLFAKFLLQSPPPLPPILTHSMKYETRKEPHHA